MSSPPQDPVQSTAAARNINAFAWALAVCPLAIVAIGTVLVLMGLPSGEDWVSVLTLAASVALVVADKRRILASGVAITGNLPATAWFVVPPVYLWKRANRLGRTKAQSWTAIACDVLAIVIPVAMLALPASNMAQADVLSGCADPEIKTGVEDTFSGWVVARNAGVKAVSLVDQEEVAQGPGKNPKKRYCRATVLASDDKEYPVEYMLEMRQGQVFIHLEIKDAP